MINLTKNTNAPLLCIILACGLLMTSCYREKDSIAIVKVIDGNSSVVSGAQVHLFPVPSGSGGVVVIDEIGTTDAKGIATFDFSEEFEPGQTGLLLLDIEVTTTDGKSGTGVMRVEEEVTNEAIIIVQ